MFVLSLTGLVFHKARADHATGSSRAGRVIPRLANSGVRATVIRVLRDKIANFCPTSFFIHSMPLSQRSFVSFIQAEMAQVKLDFSLSFFWIEPVEKSTRKMLK